MREKALNIPPQSAITKDNVHVHVSGNLYCQFVDAEKAAYGSKNPIYAVKQHAQSSMRAAIGELELDEILHARAKLNEMIKATVQESAKAWGLEIKRYEITTVSPDKFITEAMDKQAAAERHRRKKVLDAEGDKRAAELESEGVKIRMKNESEGTLIKMTNEAEAKKIKMLLEVILLSISHNISTINFLVIPMMSSTPGRGRSKGDRNARFGSSNSHQSNSRGIEGRSCI
jgi:regulator of protease activity HflC (stomatin/prohibitin superfamily)